MQNASRAAKPKRCIAPHGQPSLAETVWMVRTIPHNFEAVTLTPVDFQNVASDQDLCVRLNFPPNMDLILSRLVSAL